MSGRQWPDTEGSASPWTALASPSASGLIRLMFRDAANRNALGSQLVRWRTALARVTADVLVRPEMINNGGLPVLEYPTPAAVGDNLPTSHTFADIVARLRAVAEALDSLHEGGMVHGALARHSLWWCQDGRLRFPDAGLASMLDGVVAGPSEATPYRAPELWHGQPRTRFSDQYSLAVMAYEWMIGHSRHVDHLLEGVEALEPIMLDPAALRAAGAPLGLADVLQRALSFTPTARFESCREFVNALEVHAASVPASEPAQREHARRKRRKLSIPDRVTMARTAAAFVAVVLLLADREEVQRVASFSWLPALLPKTRIQVVPHDAPSRPRAPEEMLRGVLPDPGRDRPTLDARGGMPAFAFDASTQPTMQRGTLTSPELPSILVDVPGPALDAARLLDRTANDRAPMARNQSASGSRVTGSLTPGSRAASQPLRTPQLILDQASKADSGAAAGAGAAGASRRVDPKVPAILVLSLPADSRVYVDGVLTRDKTRVEVAAGSHDITVLTGGATIQRRVSLGAGDTVSVRLVVP